MKRIIKTILLILIPVSLAGQLAPVTNQYVLNPITINPAYAGNRGVLNVAAFTGNNGLVCREHLRL
ncbi:MAG: type IX secretion system membrane protein PorP/SprF [Bacteroidales bacterium]|nr:type IX secretion system membrane protein PorP/SprF [Bacteroidales bacterium]